MSSFFFLLNELGLSSTKWLAPIKDKASKKAFGSRSGAGFIYVIQAVDTNLIKIGLSGKPEQRVKTFQTGCPYQLEVVRVWEVSNMQAAEGAAHKAMAEYNLRHVIPNFKAKEWFFLPEGAGLPEVEEIVVNAIQGWLI